jgi:radical SAM-linked protein
MARRTPDGPPPPPVVQRLRIQYAKRGRLRFVSHRDFARSFERALRRAAVPMAYSGGFTPHPRISYVGAAPTGVASEAEYLEIGLAQPRDPGQLRAALDAALPEGLDILAVVPAGPGGLAERMEASRWRIALPGVDVAAASAALARLLAESAVTVQRMTKEGFRVVDVRGPILCAMVEPERDGGGADEARAILEVVVRQVTPAVRPDDVVAALRTVAGLALDAPPLAVRLAQGPLDTAAGRIAVGDPLAPDRAAAATAS